VSFWVDDIKEWEENNFYEVIRSCGGDLIENTKLIDQFYNKKKDKTSLCYRVFYRS